MGYWGTWLLEALFGHVTVFLARKSAQRMTVFFATGTFLAAFAVTLVADSCPMGMEE